MIIILKVNKPDSFDSHSSVKIRLKNIFSLHSSSVDYEPFLGLNSLVPQKTIFKVK